MRVLLLGATGMVGQGVVRECLRSTEVTEVVAVVRGALEIADGKLRTVRKADFYGWSDVDLRGFDACLFPLGTSAVGKSEAEYRHITYDLTVGLAEALVAASPQAVFVYVSGQGTNAKGRAMWSRVKGATEDALLALPFRGVYCFRPGYIQPLHGIRSKTGWYDALYRFGSWIYPLLRRLLPNAVTTTEAVGQAMLEVALRGWSEPVLETKAINSAAERWSTSA